MHAWCIPNNLMQTIQFKQLSGNILRIKTIRNIFCHTPGTYTCTGWNTRQPHHLHFYLYSSIMPLTFPYFHNQWGCQEKLSKDKSRGHSRALSFNCCYTFEDLPKVLDTPPTPPKYMCTKLYIQRDSCTTDTIKTT